MNVLLEASALREAPCEECVSDGISDAAHGYIIISAFDESDEIELPCVIDRRGEWIGSGIPLEDATVKRSTGTTCMFIAGRWLD